MDLLEHFITKSDPDKLLATLQEVFAERSLRDLHEFGYATDLGKEALGFEAQLCLERAVDEVMDAQTVSRPIDKKVPKKKAAKRKTKKVPKKKAAKRKTKKAAAKNTAKRKATAKKAAAKRKTPKAKKKAPTNGANRNLRLADNAKPKAGMEVCRHDNPSKVGKVVSIEPSSSSVKLRWQGGVRDVKVMAHDLVKKLRTKARANGAPKAPKGAGKPAQLDAAIVSQILNGRTTKLTCADVATALNVSPSTALRALKRLVTAGKVSAVGAGRSKAYLSTVGVAAASAAA